MDEATLARLVATEFAALEGIVYLDHALRGPLPRRAVEAMTRALALCTRGSLEREALSSLVEEARTNVARVLGADLGEIAFVQMPPPRRPRSLKESAGERAIAWSPMRVSLLRISCPGKLSRSAGSRSRSCP